MGLSPLMKVILCATGRSNPVPWAVPLVKKIMSLLGAMSLAVEIVNGSGINLSKDFIGIAHFCCFGWILGQGLNSCQKWLILLTLIMAMFIPMPPFQAAGAETSHST